MARPEKVAAVAELKDKLTRSKGSVFTDFRGLNVADMTDLRRQLRQAGVEYEVVKNTLLQIAAREAGIPPLDPLLGGPTAVAFGFQDPVAPAKVTVEFAKNHKNLAIRGAVLEGRVIDAKAVQALAALPPREVLLARVLAGMQAPVAGLVGVLNGTLRQLVYALGAVRRQKEAAAGQA